MEKEHEIKTVVPALRFPEFREMEGWRHNIVNNLTSVITAPKKITSQEYLNTGYYPIIDQSQNYICGWTNDESAVITEASLSQPLIIFGDHTCILKKVTFPFAQGADGIKILKTKECINGFFLYQILLANPVTQEEYKRHYSILKEKTIYYPIINSGEQQKIADCLSSLDDLIEATNHKIEALKEHKKGLMQRLFPKEGENVPELRFPEFQGTKGWNETVLGNVIDYENGKAHENDIDEDGKFIVVNSKFISTEGEIIKKTNSPYCLANKSDILMVLSDVPNGHAIAKCFFVDQSDKYTVNQRICRLRSKNVNSKLLFYLINRNPYFLSFDDGVKQTNLKKADVLECSLMIPTSPLEQQNIANTLSSIDKLIITTKEKIKTLKEHKKGLMQQLFPKI